VVALAGPVDVEALAVDGDVAADMARHLIARGGAPLVGGSLGAPGEVEVHVGRPPGCLPQGAGRVVVGDGGTAGGDAQLAQRGFPGEGQAVGAGGDIEVTTMVDGRRGVRGDEEDGPGAWPGHGEHDVRAPLVGQPPDADVGAVSRPGGHGVQVVALAPQEVVARLVRTLVRGIRDKRLDGWIARHDDLRCVDGDRRESHVRPAAGYFQYLYIFEKQEARTRRRRPPLPNVQLVPRVLSRSVGGRPRTAGNTRPMSDTYKGFDKGDVPTTRFRVPGAAPGAPAGPGSGNGKWSPGKRAAAILAACAVIGAGTFAAVEATSSPSTPAAATQDAAMSTTEQASTLQAAITTPGVRRLARLRFLGGLYGQFTYETKDGARTLAYERGTITLVGNGDVVVRATDGTTYTWALTSTSVVRENGTKEPESTLAQGQAVFVGGPITSGTRDARLIVIRKAATTPKTSTSSSTTA